MFKNLKRAFSSVFSSGGHDTEPENPTRFRPSGKPIVAAEINIPAARANSISSKRSISSSIVENVRKRFRRRSRSDDRLPVASHENPSLPANATEVVNCTSDTNNHLIGNLPPHLQYPPWIYQFGHGSIHPFNPASIPGLHYPPYPPLPNLVQPQLSSSAYPGFGSTEGHEQRHLSRALGSTSDVGLPSTLPGTVHDLLSHSQSHPQDYNTSGIQIAAGPKDLIQSDNHAGDSDVFSTVDRTITDNHYWCDYGPAKLVKTDDLVRDWDRSPQGHYHAHVPWSVARQLDDFNVDWSTRTHTAKHSSFTAGKLSKTIDGGYRMFRHCLGFLECANRDCARITRAQSTQARITKQVGTLCKCSHSTDPEKQFPLAHVPCPNKSTIIKYAGGLWYCNGETHDHERIPRSLHLSQKQKHHLQSLVTANPGATPAALRAGKTVSGESSLDVSDRLGNSKAARYEIEKIRPPRPASGDDFIARYVQLIHDNPNVVILNTLPQGEPVVISIQTTFMADQLARASKNEDGFNGLITDAGQKWFASRQSCLITTSVFSPTLSIWVPAVYSYANGESEAYYECHFLAVFRSLQTVKHSRGEKVMDTDLVGVMDFSQAERNGKRAAFVRFWLEDSDDTRTREELEEAYKIIPRGCHQHFRSAVTRVKKFLAVDRNTRREVIEDRQEEFQRLTHKLLRQDTAEGFLSISKSIKEAFPRSKPWIEWWERPDRVNMLVVPDGDIRSTVPDSTNAQEAAHAAMYTKHGKDHEVLTGIEKLLLISKEFERLWVLESVGALGEGKTDLERRQATKEKYGQTKKSRTPAAISQRANQRRLPVTDARPPDTIRALLSHSGQKRKRNTSSKPPVASKKRKQESLDPETQSESDVPLGGIQHTPLKSPSNRQLALIRTPIRKNCRRGPLNLVSSPIRPLKSPLVGRLRSGHRLGSESVTSSPKKVTFDDVIGHTIPSRSTTVVSKPTATIRTNYNTEHQPNGDIWLIIASGLDRLIGYKWSNNSCWMDTPLENFFWTTTRTSKSIENIVAMEGGSDLGITTIFRTLNTRKYQLLSNTSNDTMALELSSTKQALREYLVLEHNGEPKYWTNFRTLNSSDNDLGWLAAALDYC